MIHEIKNYTDAKGRGVSARTPIEGDESQAEYFGSFIADSNRGPLQLSIVFSPEYNLEKCFHDFDKEAEKAINHAIETSKGQQIELTVTNPFKEIN